MKHLPSMPETFPRINHRDAIMGLALHRRKDVVPDPAVIEATLKHHFTVHVSILIRAHLQPCCHISISIDKRASCAELLTSVWTSFQQLREQRGEQIGVLPSESMTHYALAVPVQAARVKSPSIEPTEESNNVSFTRHSLISEETSSLFGMNIPSLRRLVTRPRRRSTVVMHNGNTWKDFEYCQSDAIAFKTLSTRSKQQSEHPILQPLPKMVLLLSPFFVATERVVGSETKTREVIVSVFEESWASLVSFSRTWYKITQDVELARMQREAQWHSMEGFEQKSRRTVEAVEIDARKSLAASFEQRRADLQGPMLQQYLLAARLRAAYWNQVESGVQQLRQERGENDPLMPPPSWMLTR